MVGGYGGNIEMFFMEKNKEMGQVRLIGRNRIYGKPFLCHKVVEKKVEACGDVLIKINNPVTLDKRWFGGRRGHFLCDYKWKKEW